jgi:aspartate racemase
MHVPLLNMVDLALGALPAASTTVALLATRPTVEARIYQDALECVGKQLLVGEAWQARVDALILAIKSGANRAAARDLWRELVADLHTAGTDTLLLACTDLNLVSATVDHPLVLVDATRRLAEATVETWRALCKP